MRRPLIISRNLRTADRLGINAAKNDVHAAPILRSAARSASSIRPQGSFHPNHLSRLLRLVTEFGAGIVEPKGHDKCPPFQRLYSALGINAVRFRRSEVKIHGAVRVGRRLSFTAHCPSHLRKESATQPLVSASASHMQSTVIQRRESVPKPPCGRCCRN